MPLETVIKYPVVFIAGLIATLLITPLWQRWSPLWGFLDHPGGRKIHKRPTPVGGGVAIFFGFHSACAMVFLIPWSPFAGQISIDWWVRFIPLSVGVVFLGLIDDRYGMKPWIKLTAQMLLALGAYVLQIRIQNVLGMNLPPWVDFFGTILWFVAITNSFNLIDGVDGLAAGIALIASLGIGASLIFRASPGDVLLFLGFAGACLGFLRYNYYPASVFLGDTGSLFIGFTLAALTITTNSKGSAIAAMGIPLLAVGVPLFDMILAIWRRSIRSLLMAHHGDRARIRIDQGDADHLHHRLLRLCRRHDQVAWLLYGATALLVATGILTTTWNDHVLGILAIAFVITSYIIFRHLAWVELRDTGEMLLRGISKPVRRNRTLLFYILADIAILNVAWVIAVLLVHAQNNTLPIDIKSMWLKSVSIDITIPFLVLLFFRAYSRVWSLAGIMEYVSVGAAVGIGSAAACATNLLSIPSGAAPWNTLLHHVVMAGLAIPGIVGLRAAFRIVQDLMQHGAVADSEQGAPTRILVLGSGADIMLYLRHRAVNREQNRASLIVGLVLNDDALRHHVLNGFRVLGNMQDIPSLVGKKNIQTLYIVSELSKQQWEELRGRLQGVRIRLVQWRILEEEPTLYGNASCR